MDRHVDGRIARHRDGGRNPIRRLRDWSSTTWGR
jgi:hypothetical protein